MARSRYPDEKSHSVTDSRVCPMFENEKTIKSLMWSRKYMSKTCSDISEAPVNSDI
jgi:hypothetical protein